MAAVVELANVIRRHFEADAASWHGLHGLYARVPKGPPERSLLFLVAVAQPEHAIACGCLAVSSVLLTSLQLYDQPAQVVLYTL